MIINYIDAIIKSLGLNLCIGYTYLKIINYTNNCKFMRTSILFLSISLCILQYILKNYISKSLLVIIVYLVYAISLSKFLKNRFVYSLIVTILASAITYITFFISSFIILLLATFLKVAATNNHIIFILISLISFILIYSLFKIKRFKNGFPFIQKRAKDDYFDLFILIISIIIIFMYFLIGNYKTVHPYYLFIEFIISLIIMLIVLQKTFILYQKQKLLEKTLKEYELEIKEKDTKIEQLLTEENKLIKANHEFYHRQEALKYKLINLKEVNKENLNEEYGELISRIDTLSTEYKETIEEEKSKKVQKLPITNINELDDMFNYMQNECLKNNIEFILKIDGNIHSLINHIIPKNKLETLIGDLIRNSIIAINYSSKEYRSIMAILGIKDGFYELCVYDSGIEFQIDTLLKLGLEKATTHKESGGTGIGFITTFETLAYCNSSLIIRELEPSSNNYSKAIIVRFDGKHQYIIDTYRYTEFNKIDKTRNELIIKQN